MRLLPPTKVVFRTWLIDDLILADDRLAQFADDPVAAGLHPVGKGDVVGRIEVHAVGHDLGSYPVLSLSST